MTPSCWRALVASTTSTASAGSMITTYAIRNPWPSATIVLPFQVACSSTATR